MVFLCEYFLLFIVIIVVFSPSPFISFHVPSYIFCNHDETLQFYFHHHNSFILVTFLKQVIKNTKRWRFSVCCGIIVLEWS
eukprot:m.22818 g.22818  ORF g.22818 m.22818 type:complete len:81 (-) comp5481_c0_seq2:186-428(-)